jgi:predicted transcriptional regulator YdeE
MSPHIHALWQRFIPMLAQLESVMCDPYASYGAMRHFDPSTKQFDYMAAVEIHYPVLLPADCTVWHIPAQQYAIFDCTFALLGDMFAYVHTWLATSAYQESYGPNFEYYAADFVGQPDSPVSIYIPIIGRDMSVPRLTNAP